MDTDGICFSHYIFMACTELQYTTIAYSDSWVCY